MEILQITAANFGKLNRKLLHGRWQKLEQVGEDNVSPQFDIKLLFYVLTNYFDLAIRSLFDFVVD